MTKNSHPRDASSEFARQLERFRPWLGYILVWTILTGLSPVVLLFLKRIEFLPVVISFSLLTLIPAIWALLQAGRCPVCRHLLPNSSQGRVCGRCHSRLR